MQNEPLPLTAYSSEQRQAAMIKYQVIAPYLRSEKNLIAIVEETGIAKRTLRYWIRNYEKFGLKGLIRKTRSDSGKIQLDSEVIVTIEQMILKHRRNSLTSIHRMICEHCQQQSWKQPSYYQVYKIAQSLSQSLKNLAHDGQKAYENQYDLIHRREASYPNEIWQADHTLLDILVLNEKGKPERPWLTIILDDYSRAVAGYFLTFQAPSATQTALTLHQGIWHKQNSDWIICGIPEQFYTDHGSDFTSNHLEQVAIDLKINLVFSKVGVPRGRGKIERFFLTVNQLFLQDLPGYLGNETNTSLLTFKELDERFANFIINNYHHRIHGTTKKEPILAWNESGFLPNMPENLESLDLLLLNLAKTRKVHSDGIRFQGLRYIDTNLAAYVGETVIIRYDPRDIAEIRVFYQDKYLCTAISPEISNYTVDLKDVVSARNNVRKNLKKQLESRKTVVEEIVMSKQNGWKAQSNKSSSKKSKLKRYIND
ncbi:transposase [Bacillus pseudomycoides]|uniref:Mu transposase C-terminal domain-containing protein n=1 Tax=Bacillus pseudomycoides TaxID=64104 RepID=UPI000BEBF6FF|nr:Mu transposase C-terminal domain-containing protein [Bacillus pseudomycoides]PDX98875.1 transposase [Bacillus pseudomycoides]PEK73448.1 transposase [Bacillus pseudomycoides]PEN05150.1 transposase [Bacillus pseudomycoides]PGB79266.1 transposase [Bacillus pseudomycoides]PHE57750.1 transposase [Bacillus pseudomycoides]